MVKRAIWGEKEEAAKGNCTLCRKREGTAFVKGDRADVHLYCFDSVSQGRGGAKSKRHQTKNPGYVGATSCCLGGRKRPYPSGKPKKRRRMKKGSAKKKVGFAGGEGHSHGLSQMLVWGKGKIAKVADDQLFPALKKAKVHRKESRTEKGGLRRGINPSVWVGIRIVGGLSIKGGLRELPGGKKRLTQPYEKGDRRVSLISREAVAVS